MVFGCDFIQEFCNNIVILNHLRRVLNNNIAIFLFYYHVLINKFNESEENVTCISFSKWYVIPTIYTNNGVLQARVYN